MDWEAAGKVLNYQKAGVDKHFKFMMIYRLMGREYKMMERLHYHRMCDEMKEYLELNVGIISEEGCLYIPACEASATEAKKINRLMSKMDKRDMHRQLLKQWLEWEMKCHEIYHEASKKWSGLEKYISGNSREIQKIKRLQEKAEE